MKEEASEMHTVLPHNVSSLKKKKLFAEFPWVLRFVVIILISEAKVVRFLKSVGKSYMQKEKETKPLGSIRARYLVSSIVLRRQDRISSNQFFHLFVISGTGWRDKAVI